MRPAHAFADIPTQSFPKHLQTQMLPSRIWVPPDFEVLTSMPHIMAWLPQRVTTEKIPF